MPLLNTRPACLLVGSAIPQLIVGRLKWWSVIGLDPLDRVLQATVPMAFPPLNTNGILHPVDRVAGLALLAAQQTLVFLSLILTRILPPVPCMTCGRLNSGGVRKVLIPPTYNGFPVLAKRTCKVLVGAAPKWMTCPQFIAESALAALIGSYPLLPLILSAKVYICRLRGTHLRTTIWPSEAFAGNGKASEFDATLLEAV